MVEKHAVHLTLLITAFFFMALTFLTALLEAEHNTVLSTLIAFGICTFLAAATEMRGWDKL